MNLQSRGPVACLRQVPPWDPSYLLLGALLAGCEGVLAGLACGGDPAGGPFTTTWCVLAELRRLAERPTRGEVLARIESRAPVKTRRPAADLVREERDHG